MGIYGREQVLQLAFGILLSTVTVEESKMQAASDKKQITIGKMQKP